MQITFYSFMMAIVSSTLLIIAVFFLKKTRFFANPFGVYLMGVMYVIPLVRLFMPYRMPFGTIVIQDRYILAPVLDVLCNRSELTRDWPVLALNVLVGVMLCVSFSMFLFYGIRQYRFIKSVWRLKNYADEHEILILSHISDVVFRKRHKITLIKTPSVSTPIVVGFFHNVILLPNEAYSDTQLEMIFMHECMHLKNNDLWLKCFIFIYYCVFWWNPAMYLMKKDVDFILELKCDNLVCENLDDLSKLDYAEVINDCASNTATNQNRAVIVSAFVGKDATHLHSYRLNNLLNRKKNKNFKVEIALSIFMVFLFVMSLFFVWQPCYDISSVSDYDDAYLVEIENGNYIMCHDEYKALVFEEDVEQGFYDSCPVKNIDEPQ